MTRDPIGYFGGINVYGYVGNSQTTYTDPSGLLTLIPDVATFPVDDPPPQKLPVSSYKELECADLAEQVGLLTAELQQRWLEKYNDLQNMHLLNWTGWVNHRMQYYAVQAQLGTALAEYLGRCPGPKPEGVAAAEVWVREPSPGRPSRNPRPILTPPFEPTENFSTMDALCLPLRGGGSGFIKLLEKFGINKGISAPVLAR